MELINDLDKKLMQAGKVVTEKVRGTASGQMGQMFQAGAAGQTGTIGREAAIQKEQQKIYQCQVQIGKQFVRSLAGKRAPEQYEELCRLILESERRIKELKAKETVRPAPQAAPILQQSQAADAVCPKCGAAIERGKPFCIMCGAKLEDAAASHTPKPAEDSDMTELVVQTNFSPVQRNCPACGAEIQEGQTFCISCGQKLG